MDWLVEHYGFAGFIGVIVLWLGGISWQTKHNTSELRRKAEAEALKSLESHIHEHIDQIKKDIEKQNQLSKELGEKFSAEFKGFQNQVTDEFRHLTNMIFGLLKEGKKEGN